MRVYQSQTIPKYIQIYEWVHGMIREGALKVGDKIPTEPVLAEKFGVSRMTVRKAIDPLVLEGMVERRQGLGSFVTSSRNLTLTYDASKPIRFSHEMQLTGRSHRHDVLKAEVIRADARLQRYLDLGPDNRLILLDMLLYADDKPMIIDRSYFPYLEYRELLEMDLSIPPIQLLKDEFGVEVKKVRQYISAVCAGREEMKLFRVDYPIPCLYLEWISCDEDNLPLSISLCYYRGDAFKFSIPASELVGPDTI